MEDDIKTFLSSYGMMTAERILMRYSLPLSSNDLMTALKNKNSFYNQLLKVPFKNVLNGIIIQQAYDYYVFAQKLYVDYLLSGESGKSEGTPGMSAREDLETDRQYLLTLGENYQDIQSEQDTFISESQAWLINYASRLRAAKAQGMKNSLSLLSSYDPKRMETAYTTALIYNDYNQFIHNFADALGYGSDEAFKSKLAQAWEATVTHIDMLNPQLATYIENGKYMAKKAKDLRTQFYELILRVRTTIIHLPEYTHDAEQERRNKEALYFDSSIGDWG